MSKKNETIQRPISLQPGESASVVSPIYPSVVYASKTPDMLDDQYEGRIQGYKQIRPIAWIASTRPWREL